MSLSRHSYTNMYEILCVLYSSMPLLPYSLYAYTYNNYIVMTSSIYVYMLAMNEIISMSTLILYSSYLSKNR